jgi:hypothetical protein
MILKEVRMESTISAEDVKAKLDRKDPVKVVETLAPERYREAHLPGALNIPPGTDQRTRSAIVAQRVTPAWRIIPRESKDGWKRDFQWRRLLRIVLGRSFLFPSMCVLSGKRKSALQL